MKNETSQTKVTISHSRSDVYKRRPELLRRGAEFLRPEIEKYVMNVYPEKSELIESFINYTICRKHYYSEPKYYSAFENMELIEELDSKDAIVDDYYLVFTRFLVCGTESIVLMKMGCEPAVPEAFLKECVEEVDNLGDDWYTILTDFLDTYTYDDIGEIQSELDRK